MAKQARFGWNELNLFSEALCVAEESVSEYFNLSEGSWSGYPYEVRTLAQLSPIELSDDALAQILRLRQLSRPGRLREWDFYRICVQDHNLLGLLQREKAGELFLPLCIYVLAHELVHVVRFYRFQHLYEASGPQRKNEENRVHAITRRALADAKIKSLDTVINLYQQQEG